MALRAAACIRDAWEGYTTSEDYTLVVVKVGPIRLKRKGLKDWIAVPASPKVGPSDLCISKDDFVWEIERVRPTRESGDNFSTCER